MKHGTCQAASERLEVECHAGPRQGEAGEYSRNEKAPFHGGHSLFSYSPLPSLQSASDWLFRGTKTEKGDRLERSRRGVGAGAAGGGPADSKGTVKRGRRPRVTHNCLAKYCNCERWFHAISLALRMNMKGTHVPRLKNGLHRGGATRRGEQFDIEVPRWGVRAWRSEDLSHAKDFSTPRTFQSQGKVFLFFFFVSPWPKSLLNVKRIWGYSKTED